VVGEGTQRLKVGLGVRDGAERDGGSIILPGVLGKGEEVQADRDCEVVLVLVQASQWHQHAKDGGLSPRGSPRVENEGKGGAGAISGEGG